ncbi:MAG: hypothetical protein AAFX99_18235, partial [Myxococcota bacterium]
AVEDGTREAKRLEQRRQILIALHLWWKDWSTVAHNNLRRQYLVWLGLVSHAKTTPTDDEPPKSTL